MKKILCLLSILLCVMKGYGQAFTFLPDRYTQRIKSSQIAATAFPYTLPFTQDNEYSALLGGTAVIGTDYKFKDVENIVRVGIDQDTNRIVPAFKYRISLELRLYSLPGPSVITQNITLDLSYNPDSLQQYNDLAVFRATGYHAMQVRVLSVSNIAGMSPVAVPAAAVARNFYVESEVSTHRYDLIPQNIVSNCAPAPGNRELDVFWQLYPTSGTAPCKAPSVLPAISYKPVAYELEWCYIDDYHFDLASGTASYLFSGGGNINYDFRKNSTRVQITKGNTFRIPLLYEHGAIIYRMRMVRPDAIRYKDLVYGNWNFPDNGTINASSPCFSANGFLVSSAHLSDSLNWQYTINFAEDGKYKHVINYFDGSLKDRQTQTRINSDASYIIAVDKVYDYEGRPSLVSLPIPVADQSTLAYRPDILLNSKTAKPYRAQDFDIQACSSPDSIAPLSAAAKANIYYSPSNPYKTGMQRFVPDAKGYPMVQTVYSPDNTNKVLWQGGAGLEQQLWRGHGTQYEYSRATQTEMDRLLGTEVGLHQYYPKQVVTDPNGQSSYSIMDPAGKVIISGLQGPSPDPAQKPIEALPNLAPGVQVCEDLLSDNNQRRAEQSISAQLPLYNDALANTTFEYRVKTIPYNTGCSGQYLSVAGLYDIAVVNDCGNTLATLQGTVSQTKAGISSAPVRATAAQTVFGMPRGSHMVSKQLRFSEYDIYHLADSFVSANQPNCYRDVYSFIKEAIDSTQFPCEGFAKTDISHCEAMKMQMKRDLYPGAKYGGYTKKEDSTFGVGTANSFLERKAKPIGDPAVPNDSLGYKYIIRTGYDGAVKLNIGDVDPVWKVSLNGLDYYDNEVSFYYPAIPAWAMWGSPVYITEDPPGPPYFTRSRFRAFITIPEDVPLDKVYLRGSLGDHLDSVVINDIVNTVNYFGENYDVQGFQHGLNEVIFWGENDAEVYPLGHNYLSTFSAFAVGYDPYYKFPYQDTCIHLPDSVVKDGIVYKDLKNLPVQTLIEIFNDDIAEALLPLHPEYCKLQNCNDANFEQVLEQTRSWEQALANNMSSLDSLVAHDPLVLLGGGTAAAARLQYINGVSTRIDTLALQLAYCGAGNMEQLQYCTAKDYQNEISHFIFLNHTVKQNYFNNLKSLYTGNRSLLKQIRLDSTTAGCARCSSARLSISGVPVFPSMNDAITAGSGGGDADDAGLPEWMRELFRKAKDKDSSSMSSVPDPLRDSMNAINQDFAEAEAGNLLEHLKNCTLNQTLRDNMYRAALNVLKSGRKLSPAIVKSIITDTVSLALNDLCHPFLVAYDIMPDTRSLSTTYACAPSGTYSGLKAFLQKSQVTNAMKTATSVPAAAVPITAGNDFEYLFGTGTLMVSSYLDGVSPLCSNCYVNLIVSGSLRTDTLHILAQQYTGVSDIKASLNSTTPVYSISGVRCINSDAAAMADGAMAKNTAIIDLLPSGSLVPVSYYIWSAATPLMLDAPSAASLKNSIACPDITAALADFKAEQATYGYSEALNHPLYRFTLTNYLNYKLSKSYLLPDYEQLMEGCAVTDRVSLKRLLTHYRVEFSSDLAADNFITDLQAYGTAKPDYLRYKPLSGNPVILVNFNSMGTDTLLAYKNFIAGYGGVVSSTWQYSSSPDNTHVLISRSSCTFNPAAFAGIYSTQDVSVMEDGTYNSAYKLHSFRLSGTPTPKEEADLLAAVEQYLHVTTAGTSPSCNVTYPLYGRALLRSADYSSTLKQQYLSYVYGLSAGSHDDLITAIDPANLGAALPAYSSRQFTYDDPFCRGNRRHLYAYEPSPSSCTGYNLLRNDILNNLGSTLFPNTGFAYRPALGSRLAVIRKANGDYWYRYFDAANRLYNVYITPPDAALAVPWENYSFSLSGARMGADPYSFTVTVSYAGNNVLCRGYTDFPLCSLSVVAQDVILDKDPKGVFCFDSLDCEHEVLARTILNGKAAYEQYFKTTVKDLGDRLLSHALMTTMDTLIYCGRRQQYQQTLYYYDLAGNLSSTIPPAGVDTLPTAVLPNVQFSRTGPGPDAKMILHRKESVYRYNSLNQLVYQKTPDGGTTSFYYDAAGRQIFSQDNRQKATGNYTYSLYDDQGRPQETGEITLGSVPPDFVRNAFDEQTYSYDTLRKLARAQIRREVVHTHYDEWTRDLGAVTTDRLGTQENLRGRVAAIRYYDELPAGVAAHNDVTFGTYFSYDVSGNVQQLVYEYPRLELLHNIRYNKVHYDYDLISGKVNMISYNRGHPDQFFQLYDYDADNRITRVQTSSDGLIWNTDARYDYYRHGPLASLKLGQHKVQSLEYAYTIQGWLKSVNTDVLNSAMDMGRNGLSMATPPPPNGDQLYARDVIAHALHYFKDDYKAIGTDVATQLSYVADKSLYNGNITQQTTGIGGVGTLQRTYTYDQLQRLKTAANKSVNDATAAVIAGPASLYASNYSYDKDGNIKTLQRWDGNPGMPVQIDNFTYNYQAGDTNNRLFQVADAAAPGSGSDLKPGQGPVNYSYDENGNLAGDLQAQHSIIWNRFGKVKTILTPSASRRIEFGYDGRGNRIWKDVVEAGPVETHRAEYYVRDASGNQLATYRSWSRKNAGEPISLPGDTLHLSEHHIYGSSRLGIQKYDSATIANIRPNPMAPGPLPPPQAVLNQQSAWYSYVYADRIGGGYTEPYGSTGNTDFNPTFTQRKLGRRYYELTDHLGNVLATVLDRRTGSGSFAGPGASFYDHWHADIAQASDYYPGGMMMPGRYKEYDWSRMGSQSQQKDDEVYGKGNLYAYKYRMNDARINRFFSPDPLHRQYPHNSDYAFAENDLTRAIELEGLEKYIVTIDKAWKNGAQDITYTKIQLPKAGSLGNGVAVRLNYFGDTRYFYGNSAASAQDFTQYYEGNGIPGHPFERYNDSRGYATIGYGHFMSNADKARWPNTASNSPFAVGSKMSSSEADALFAADYPKHKEMTLHSLKTSLSGNQLDAMIDFGFNIKDAEKRIGEFTAEKGGNFFLEYMKGGAGLEKRRIGESILFNEGDYIKFDQVKGNSATKIEEQIK